jgi:RHS repeat-associated protein
LGIAPPQAETVPVAMTLVTTETVTETWYHQFNGQLVAMRQTINDIDQGVQFLLSDHLGSTTISYDPATDDVSRQYYNPWGELRGASEPVLDTDIGYTGQRLDTSADLMYYNARYYDPTIGRFISADTIIPNPADPQSLNRYSYVRNNPIRYSDPSGNTELNTPAIDGGYCYGEGPRGFGNYCTWQRRYAEEVNSMTPHKKRVWLAWNGDPARYMVDALRQFEQNYPDALEPDVLSSEYALLGLYTHGGGEMDIKGEIRKGQGGEYYGSIGGGWEVRFDVWGNVLYGIMAKRLELEPTATTFFAWAEGRLKPGSESDLGDQIAIDVGYRIGDRIGNDWSLLTPELVIEELFNSYQDFVDAAQGTGPNDLRIRRESTVGVPL